MKRATFHRMGPWAAFLFVLSTALALMGPRAHAVRGCCNCSCLTPAGTIIASTEVELEPECDLETCSVLCSECAGQALQEPAPEYLPFAYNIGCYGACIPAGACCDMLTAACATDSEAECLSVSGREWVAGAFCFPDPCRVTLGACCNPDTGECTLTDEPGCGGPGTWQAGVPCDPNPCEQPVPEVASVPTMTEWGMIGFVLLAGILAVLTLRRRGT